MRWYVAIFVFCLALIAFGCSEERDSSPLTPTTDFEPVVGVETLAWAIAEQSGWPLDEEQSQAIAPDVLRQRGHLPAIQMERDVLAGDIVHYSFRVPVGCGEYDVIGLHRVIRESRPYRPIRTHKTIMMQHGDYKDFAGCFLPGLKSPRIPDDVGFAVYLAENDVDVWGIDQSWCLVPGDVSDVSFMMDWDMQRQVDDLGTAIQVARLVRRLGGNGYHRMLLSGYSAGGPIGFALLNQETQLPPGRRHVSGFIPGDQAVKTDDPVWAVVCCSVSAVYKAIIDGGQAAESVPLPIFGGLASDDPQGPSPIPGFEGLTNLQAGLILGTYPFFEGVTGHFLAGIMDPSGLPTGLQFVATDDWVDFMRFAPAYEPAAFLRDEYITNCTDSTPYDDHLAEIRVPILYVQARGGFGYTGTHTLDLLGSSDITSIEATAGIEDVLLDYGHIDLFLANTADALVWRPVVDWIEEHSE